jgi:peroxygenase
MTLAAAEAGSAAVRVSLLGVDLARATQPVETNRQELRMSIEVRVMVATMAACLAAGCVDEPATGEDTEALGWSNPPRAEPAIPWDEMTPLQKHVSFFDFNGDGYVTVIEDYRGLRALGIDPVSSSAFAFAINAALGSSTSGYPSLTISIEGIADGEHGSDTGIYDADGNFVPEAFDHLFDQWDRNGSGGLDPAELAARAIDDADLFDLFGITASAGEFGLLYAVAAEDGELTRDRMSAFYDGTLFYDLAEERAGTIWWGWWL